MVVFENNSISLGILYVSISRRLIIVVQMVRDKPCCENECGTLNMIFSNFNSNYVVENQL